MAFPLHDHLVQSLLTAVLPLSSLRMRFPAAPFREFIPMGRDEMKKIKTMVLLLGALLLQAALLTACDPRRPAVKKTDPDAANREDTPAAAPPVTDPSNLPPYILTHADAEKLRSPLVLAFVPDPLPKTPDVPSYQGLEAFRGFVQEFLNRAMLLPALAPGRRLSVFVEDDPTINAFADGYQRIVVQRGAVEGMDQASMLELLCHETAHSTRNHVAAQVPIADQVFGTKAAPSAAYESVMNEANAYLNQQTVNGVYTHAKASYAAIQQRLLAVVAPYNTANKRSESEADIVGAFTCAQMGVSPAAYLSAFKRGSEIIAASMAGVKSPESIADGTKLQVPPGEMENFFYYLFYLDTHPTHEERIEQISRLTDVIQKEFKPSPPLIAEWKQNTGSFLDSSAIALIGDEAALTGRIVLQGLDGAPAVIMPPLDPREKALRSRIRTPQN